MNILAALFILISPSSVYSLVDVKAIENRIKNSPNASGIQEALRVLPKNPKIAVEGLAEGLAFTHDEAIAYALWQIAIGHEDAQFRKLTLEKIDDELAWRVENSYSPLVFLVTYIAQVALSHIGNETGITAALILGNYLGDHKDEPRWKKFTASIEGNFWGIARKLLELRNVNNLKSMVDLLESKSSYITRACSSQKQTLLCQEIKLWLLSAYEIFRDSGERKYAEKAIRLGNLKI